MNDSTSRATAHATGQPRLIVCDDCHKRRRHHALGRCLRCYRRLQYRRATLRADGLLTSDYYRRWQESRRPGLPRRVYGLTGLISEEVA